MRVAELGEIPLIKRIVSLLPEIGQGQDLLLGPGDDTAAWRSPYPITLSTTDALIQGVHFLSSTISWRDLGWKALAVNLSDIAAMGGTPTYALVSLDLPPDTEVESVVDFYRGFLDLAARFEVTIAGGNVSRADRVSVHITLMGGLPSESMLRRSAAKPGDAIAVTGHLGASAAGLRLIKAKKEGPAAEALLQAHRRPWPRVQEGKSLLQLGIKAAMDISDGLLSDLGQLCLASKLTARIWADRIPIHPNVREVFTRQALRLALAGGEDYELLFSCPPGLVEQARKSLPVPLTVIGELEDGEAGKVVILDRWGQELPAVERGWDHFRR